MSSQHTSPEDIVHIIEERDHLRHIMNLITEVDGHLEEAILHKWPVRKTLDILLPRSLDLLDAHAIMVRTFDETSNPVDLFAPNAGVFEGFDLDALCAQVREHDTIERTINGLTVLGYRLDVTDTYLGSVLLLTQGHTELPMARHAECLMHWCELLDNYLAAISDARRKHTAMQELSDALREPILDEGLDRALETLRRYLPFSDMLLTLKYEASLDINTINYRVISGDDLWHTTLPEESSSPELHDAILATLDGEVDVLVEHFDLHTERTSLNILDAHDRAVVGHISLHAPPEALTPFALDLLDRFADYIRQRIVDFNKEWKHLSRNFPLHIVRRLLQSEHYAQTYLSPQEHHVTILYCDISGFTRLSEQILKQPALIGKLIDIWSSQVVDFIWESGGVFDKMVGDCIIGLWGPPFYERTAREECAAALDAAERIRDYTSSLLSHPDIPELHGADLKLGVATGLNHAPLFVGTFGPDENFTGFSSGMNNTARLQGVASCDEILCMEAFIETLGDPSRFGERHEAQVKNVAQPLVYRALVKTSAS